MSMQSVEEYERRAQEAEASSVPVFLKVARAMVWFLYAITVVTVVVLLLAFVLRLLGASTDAAFTRWVYRSSESMMRPFRGIFPVQEVGEQSVVDVSLLIGAVAYLMLAVGVDALVQRIDRASTASRSRSPLPAPTPTTSDCSSRRNSSRPRTPRSSRLRPSSSPCNRKPCDVSNKRRSASASVVWVRS